MREIKTCKLRFEMYEMYSVGNIANTYAMSLCGDRW